jgi:hypothetical protein
MGVMVAGAAMIRVQRLTGTCGSRRRQVRVSPATARIPGITA